MKFATYLFLIGSAAAQCTSQEKVDTSAAKSTKASAYATALTLKTPEVEAFEIELVAAQKHLNEMMEAELKVDTAVVADVTAAKSNVTSAQAALDAILTATGNPALNKILVDITTADTENKAAIEAYNKAHVACVPSSVADYHTQQQDALKLKYNYDAMSAEDKAAMDKKMAERQTKVLANDAELKLASKYHEMTQAEQDMYDRMLIAQKTLDAEDREEISAKMGKDGMGMTQETYDALTTDKKLTADKKLSMMKNLYDARKIKEQKDDNDVRTESGFFKNLTTAQQAVFNKKMGDQQQSRKQDNSDFMDKIKAMKEKADYNKMTEVQKIEFLQDIMEDREMQKDRNDMFDKQDMSQRSKMGYFDKMTDKERAAYDAKSDSMRKDRQGKFGDMDKTMSDSKSQAGFQNMDRDGKNSFMCDVRNNMQTNAKQMIKDRLDDDDIRQKMQYFKQDQTGRQSIDTQVQNKQNQRGQQRMAPTGSLAIGQTCTPDMGRQGGNGGRGGQQMGGQQSGSQQMGSKQQGPRCDDQKDGQNKGGMMQKFGGNQGMQQKMGMMGQNGGQQGGRRMLQAPGGMQGAPQGDQCGDGLCCGQTLYSGVWQEKYICNTATASMYDKYRFQCVEQAKTIVAGALSLMTAAYIMV